MKVTDAGTTIVLSDTTPEEKQRILSAIKHPEEQALETLSRKDVAKIFGVSTMSLKRWEKAGKLHAVRITARTVRYNAQEIRAIVGGAA